jgi:hypothetical protein
VAYASLEAILPWRRESRRLVSVGKSRRLAERWDDRYPLAPEYFRETNFQTELTQIDARERATEQLGY